MGTLRKSVVLGVGLVGMFAGLARAQETLVARIPFPFVARGAELPAGRYDIVDDQGVITIRSNDIHHASAAVAMATPASGQDPEGRYTLSQIWESDTKGLALLGRSARGRRVGALSPASEPPTVVAAEDPKAHAGF